jgi:hypothetical protein
MRVHGWRRASATPPGFFPSLPRGLLDESSGTEDQIAVHSQGADRVL